MHFLALMVTLGVIVFLGLKKPYLLVTLLAGSVAFEISILWYPSFGKAGSELGTISLARLLTIAIIAFALLGIVRNKSYLDKLKLALRQPLSVAILIYVGLGGLSLLYSADRTKTVIETVRLLSLFVLFLSIVLLSRKDQAAQIFKLLHWVGVALVPLALYQAKTLHFLWYTNLAAGENVRVNATFVDPNIFARFLVLAVVSNLILQILCRGLRSRLIYTASLLALVSGLAVTLSRSGLVTMACVLAVMLVLLPKGEVVQSVGLLGVAGTGIVLFRPAVWNRLDTLKHGLGAMDSQRQYLWKVAVEMFKAHPITGVGLGGFQKVFLTKYLYLKTVPEGATLSHTTVLTIAAELGILGLLALSWIWICVLRLLLGLRNNPKGYILGVGYFLWILTIFISSQSEARFFEDPIIWLSMSMLFTLGPTGGEVK